MTFARAVSLGAILVALSAAAGARAQSPDPEPAPPTEAEAAFKQGLAEMTNGRFDAGCPLLEKSHRLAPNELGVLFTLAECEWKRGRLATASTRYGEYLQSLAFLPPAQRAAQADRQRIAEEQRAAIQVDVPKVTLLLPPGAPPETAIILDGVAVVSPVGVEVDPGAHDVETRLPSGATRAQKISIAKGQRHTVLLVLPGSAATAPSLLDANGAAGPERASPHPLRWAVWTAGGVGAAGVGVGTVAGIFTFARASDARAHCAGHLCDPAGLDAVSAGRSAGSVSTVAFAVGGAGLAAAALLYFVDRRGDASKAAALVASPGQAALRGAW